jgi:SAM-dependent methyltransferase
VRDDPNPSKPEVDALIEQIREAARLQRTLPARGGNVGSADSSTESSSGLLDSYLAELARRSHPRTELPIRFRRFPLTLAPVRSIALRLYSLLTREQRAGYVLVRDALQAIQTSLTRNEMGSRETAILTEYVRALLMGGKFARAPEERPATSASDETSGGRPAAMDAFFAALGDEFRGSPELIKDRLRVYLPMIRATALSGPALDLGCGRGEWLELMRGAGIESIGVEQNRILADACENKNFQVIEADFVAFLAQSPPDHWRIVTGFHVIEHLGWPAWYDCLRHIHRVLMPDGMVILETPNPANLITAANRFYLDPTHRHPLPDALLAFAARSIGFASVQILPLHPGAERPAATDAGAGAGIAGAETMRAMHGPQDYALIARK